MNYKEKIINILTRGELTSEQEEQLEKIFPELAENEDEKIRKALISVLKSDFENDTTIHDISVSDIIAWLEKQSEPKEYTFKSLPRLLDMIEPTSKAKAYCQKLIDTLVKEGYATDAKIVGECLKQMNGEDVPMAVMDENQDEQKPTDTCDSSIINSKEFPASEKQDFGYLSKSTDKLDLNYSNKPAYNVEPKFKNGQWIVWKDKCYRVNYNACGYEVFDQNGWSTSWDYKTIEDNAHIWTIKDAKDGDVLTDGKKIVIFKQFDEPVYRQHLIAHIGLDIGGYIQVTDGTWRFKEIKPAAKKHRDLLFSKMKEAGYEWSDKDKKLIKTEEQNEEISEELKAASILHSELVRNQSCIDEDFIDGAQWLKRQIAWNEEDEKMLKSAVGAVWVADYYTYDDKQEIEDWLKSLKERLKGK